MTTTLHRFAQPFRGCLLPLCLLHVRGLDLIQTLVGVNERCIEYQLDYFEQFEISRVGAGKFLSKQSAVIDLTSRYSLLSGSTLPLFMLCVQWFLGRKIIQSLAVDGDDDADVLSACMLTRLHVFWLR